jgi:spore coat protein CotH
MIKKLIHTVFLSLVISFAKAQSTDGDLMFNTSVIHTVNFYFTQPSFWDSLVAYKPLDKPMFGSVDIDGTLMDSVGIQLKGNSSYNSMPGVKKSFKISFDEFVSQKFDGLKTLNLNNAFKDPSFLREKLMCDFMNDHGIPAPRCTYADVYINGTHWGFYTMIEQVNKTFLTGRFGNNDGNLFKGDPHGDLRWHGTVQSSYYNDYELKTNETVNDWSDLVHLTDRINNPSPAEFYDSLESVMVSDLAIKAWAANNLFVNLDSYLGSGHNYYIYDDFITNKFEWITWDVNEAFGNFNMGIPVAQIKTLDVLFISQPPMNRPLQNRMMQNLVYKTSYLDYLCQWIQNDFSLAAMGPKIDSIADVIRPYVYADPNKQFTNANFDSNIDFDMGNIPGIKDFIAARSASLNSQLQQFGCSPLGVDESNKENSFSIYPNPFSESTVFGNAASKIQNAELTVRDLTGQELMNTKIASFPYVFSRVNFKSGIYFYQIKSDGAATFSGKMVIE